MMDATIAPAHRQTVADRAKVVATTTAAAATSRLTGVQTDATRADGASKRVTQATSTRARITFDLLGFIDIRLILQIPNAIYISTKKRNSLLVCPAFSNRVDRISDRSS